MHQTALFSPGSPRRVASMTHVCTNFLEELQPGVAAALWPKVPAEKDAERKTLERQFITPAHAAFDNIFTDYGPPLEPLVPLNGETTGKLWNLENHQTSSRRSKYICSLYYTNDWMYFVQSKASRASRFAKISDV
ncbi:hypothetical protein KM043_012516 [Ampulex compressa]|nr:hypothetical protein KM043_012516 [Ampulex compressa]